MICHLHYCRREECEERHASPDSTRVELNSGDIGAPAIITFKPAVFEHIYAPWEKPERIETPQRLREECAKRGVTSEYLHNSLLWRSGPTRWV